MSGLIRSAENQSSSEPNPGILNACEAIGDIIEFWGFKRVLGRIWTLLYLSDQALSAQQIGHCLNLSTGAVSMALQEMEHWGLIQRESQRGKRQFLYRAETRIWQMIARVVRLRELHQLERLSHTLHQSLATLGRNEFASNRLKRLLLFVECGTEVFRIGFQEKPLDLNSLQRIGRLRQVFQKTSVSDT